MTARETLLALAARCEAATGADGILDADIMAVLHPELSGAGWERVTHPNGKWAFFADRDRDSGNVVSPHRYTASVDAAMTLVPEGWVTADANNLNIPRNNGGWAWALDNGVDCGHPQFRDAVAKAATPALALSAAALLARAEGLA